MKLKESFITHKNKDDYMMIDASGKFAGIIHSNATAAFIIECLKTETTEDEILEKMIAKYDADKNIMADNVREIIDKLRKIEAVDE
ncbi:MAG: PqqD family protein [Oscillospiraceae bacterium]|nr:PqqD family protein [Oscillospiraceae bacterium]